MIGNYSEGLRMKLSFARIVTTDVPVLTRFYREITGIAPKLFHDAYVEFSADGASLAITQGDRGGLVVHGTHGDDGERRLDLRHYPAVRSHRPVDPTGAGDVFLAALAAARIEPRLIGGRVGHGLDLLLAAAAASLVLEGAGLLGVPTREAVAARMREGAVAGAAAPR